MSVSSEHARIARLTRRLRGTSRAGDVGIGDDAAVLGPDLVVSVDAAVAGVHFLPRFAPWDVLARRAAVAALSDLAAMGAAPLGMLSSLVLPPSLDDETFDAIIEGFAVAAEEHGAPVIGGNLAAGAEVSITTTVLGRTPAPLLRAGARPGDGVYVTGAPGAAALGLAALLAEREAEPRFAHFVDAWRHPHARLDAGMALRGHASAAIDVSDGLLADLGHLCVASDCGATLDVEALPHDEAFDAAAAALSKDPLALVLGGGEVYELLFTASREPPIDATRIGVIDADRGLRLRHADGSTTAATVAGFDHFAHG